MVQHHTKPAEPAGTGSTGSTRSRRTATGRVVREPARTPAGGRTATGRPRKSATDAGPRASALTGDTPAARPLRAAGNRLRPAHRPATGGDGFAAPGAGRTTAAGLGGGHPAPSPRAAAAPGTRKEPAAATRGGKAARSDASAEGADADAWSARVTGPRLEVVRTPAGVARTGGTEEIVPGRPLPPLRVLRVPRCEPADEPEYVPLGAAVIPFPVRPPVPEPPYLRLVGAPVPATPREPDPAEARRQVHRFAVALAEVLSGARALRQLGDRVTPEVRDRVAHLQRDLGARQVAGVSLVASNATAPTDDTAEGFLRLRLAGPDRFQAVAVRLDHQTPRARPNRPPIWVCTALHHR